MLTTILFAIAIVALPTVLVLGTLALLGVAVASLAEGLPNGFIRPTAS